MNKKYFSNYLIWRNESVYFDVCSDVKGEERGGEIKEAALTIDSA